MRHASPPFGVDAPEFCALREKAREQTSNGEPVLGPGLTGADARNQTIARLDRDMFGKPPRDEEAEEAKFFRAEAAYAFGVAMGAEWVLLALGSRKGRRS